MKYVMMIVLSLFFATSSVTFAEIKKVEAPAVAAVPAPAPVVTSTTTAAAVDATQVVAPIPSIEVKTDAPEMSEYTALFKSLGGLKGMGVLGIIAFLMQVIVLLARGPLGNFAGRYKLLIIYAGTLVMGVIGLKVGVPGMDWAAAILHSNTLAMLQVTGNQVKKQFVDKADEPAIAKPA